jgi:type IV pilus assembly protein PilE
MAPKKVAAAGFSLLELMVVLAVIGTLLTIAIPSYRQYVQRGHRAEAIRIILATSDCLGRTRVATGFFDATHCLPFPLSTNYRYSIQAPGSPLAETYTITALPLSTVEEQCGALSLDHTGNRAISDPQGSTGRCWGGR